MLSAVSWTSATSGSWDVASNWSTDKVPGAGDDVVIHVAGASPTVTISSKVESVHSITADDPLAISGGGLTVAASSTISGGLAMTAGSLTADGSGISLTVAGTTTDTGGNLYAEGGAKLSLPHLTSYTQPYTYYSSTIEATGSGSVVSMTGLTSLSVSDGFDAGGSLQALSGGDIEVPALAQLSGPVHVESENADSTINLSGLTEINGGSLTVTGGGTILDGSLATLTAGSLTIGSGSYSLPTLTDIDSSSVDVEGGASLKLPDLKSYSEPYGYTNTALQASGAGSVLSLPELTAMSVTGSFDASATLEADGGGDIEAPAVTQLSGPVEVKSENASSRINLSGLTDINGGSITVTTGGMVLYGSLASLTSGSLTIESGSYSLPALTDIDSSNLDVQGAASLTLPSVTTYTQRDGFLTSTLQASGVGSVLSLPALKSISVTGFAADTQVQAEGGGDVELTAVTQLTGGVQVDSDGTASLVSLTDLATLGGSNFDFSNGGSLEIANAVVSMPAAGTSVTINVPPLPKGMVINLASTGTFTDATFNISQGDTVNLRSGAYVGATFNVAQGATLDLTGGQTVTYSGMFTGSGKGSVQLSSGTLAIAVGGATFNFPGSFFQWTGGAINGAGGTLTNKGTINLAGSNEKVLYNDGTLDNFGLIIQTGTGNLGLHSDNQAPTILENEPGGSYLIESDSGVNNPSGGETEIDNSGLIQKTAGTGTTTILVNGRLSNTGTIEADSGNISLSATVAQISGNTLKAGTWNALHGSTLVFPGGTTITSNQGNITLDGNGAAVVARSGRTSNSGRLSLMNGASFSTAGDLSNTGSLTVGAASKLAVKGNYTQGANATLAVDIGGSAVSGQYGQLVITGSAALAGTVSTMFIDGFSPTAGDSYQIATFASETGGSSLAFAGLGSGAYSYIQPAVNATAIDLATTMSAADLSIEPFSVAANGTVGQSITIDYQVQNLSANAASGDWYDSFFLSTTTSLNVNALSIGNVEHSGGVTAQGSYTGTITATLPGVAPGQYYVIGEIDSKGLVPDVDRANDVAASSNPINVAIPSATLGESVSGTIDNGQDAFYQITVPAGQDLAIDASFAALQGGELYVGYQSVPTTSTYLASSTSATQITQQVVIPETQAGVYDILLHGDTGSTGGKPFTLSTVSLPLQVSDVSPMAAGNAGTTTLTIQGAEFTASAAVSLVPHAGGKPIAATQVTFQGSTTVFARFNLAGAEAGGYDVVVTDGAQKATEPSAFTVTSNASPGQISYNLSVPLVSRPGRIAYLTLTYSNDGGSNALAPLFVVSVTSDNATIGLPGETSFVGSSIQVLGIESTGPAGTLPPGYQGTLLIPYESTTLVTGASIKFSLQVMTGDGTPMNWSSLESTLQPSYMSSAAWSAVFANLTASFGPTTDTYLAALDNEATYLSQLGEYTDDVQRLFGFAINTANDPATSGSLDLVTDGSFPVPGAIALDFVRQFNSSISGRDTMGPLGMGWTDNWQISASANSDGNVTISDDGSLLYFAKQISGSYLEAPGEYGTLALVSGAYQYIQTDGTTIAFNTDGTLNYERDTNGNRITAGYSSGGELTSLTDSNGSAITIGYNAQGLISQITGPSGQSTSYKYDASGEHLLTVSDEFGKSTYTYASGPTAADANALTSITLADGTGLEYTYDALGRLATEGGLGGAETQTYAYPAPGEIAVTNADGNTTSIFGDDRGNLAEMIDPLGNITRNTFDANGNLVKTVAADGTTTTYTYDANGNMTSETDALGNKVQFTYNLLAEPLTFVNQQGDATSYQYDAAGNLLETMNPNGTNQHNVYNALGEVASSTDADGETITYAYNSDAQLIAQNFPDGTSDTYTYDSFGNMLTADSSSGDWSFTYNSQNLPTAISEPYGTLSVQYGIDGNVTQIVDQTGFKVKYGYDSIGRLSQLTDGNGDLIESYTYDPAGNVISETKGNGTGTTYQYNAEGEVTQIANLASGGAINSKMAYAYNAVGEVSSMTTGGVTTDYAYDADGEVLSTSSPGDTILYAYDPDGNRTSVTNNGVLTNYVSNDVNEYTSSATSGANTTYRYDANGNLIGASTNGQTTTYSFNALSQLAGVSGSTGTYSYVYDALGNQISSVANGETTNNLIDPVGPANVAAQLNGSGNLTARYMYGLGLVSQVNTSGTSYYYDYNLQGSTVGITNGAGAYVNQYSYDPFGQVTTISAGIANPFTFVGQYGASTDGNSLTYMRARYYDPDTGQFASNDPLDLAGGDSNTRRYVTNNPLILVDASGMDFSGVYGFAGDTISQYSGDQNFIGSVVPVSYYSGPSSGAGVNIGGVGGVSGVPANPDNHFPSGGPVSNYSGPSSGAGHCNGGVGGVSGVPANPDDHFPNGGPVSNYSGARNGTGYHGGVGGASGVPGNSNNHFPNSGPIPYHPNPRSLAGDISGGGSENVVPHDPNDLLGPAGYGSAGFLTAGLALPYTIEFSNEKTAQVPADNVVVTEQLSPNLDWSTFQLGTIGFGSYVVNVPAGLTSYSTRVDTTATLGVYVDVEASLNLSTGLLTVKFTSLDPTTLDTPANPLVGFLPPDTAPPNGEGYINYTIQPEAALATGASLDAQASIVFDTNAAIATPQITNTIDASPPTSTVVALPQTATSTNFTVSWSGSDGAGPGIADYNVYVSDNGGGFTLWQANTTATTAIYTGRADHTYRFYSVATDNVGLVQSTPVSGQATIEVVPPPPPPPPPTPPVIVTSVRWETVKVKLGSGKKAKTKSETALEIQFSAPVAGAGDLAAYQLAGVMTKKVKKKPVTTYKPIKLASALPASNPTTSSVSLFPAAKPNLSQTDHLEINALDLTDAMGRALDGNDDGKPGGSFLATFWKSGVNVDAVNLARVANGRPAVAIRAGSEEPRTTRAHIRAGKGDLRSTPDPRIARAAAIDALLVRGELAHLKALGAAGATESRVREHSAVR